MPSRTHLFAAITIAFVVATAGPAASLGSFASNDQRGFERSELPAPGGVGEHDSANVLRLGDTRTTAFNIDIESTYEWAAAGSRCDISADLLYAVGSVASANGRLTDTTFDRAATSQPAIYGAAGDGTNANLALLLDTDGGAIDSDTMWDRPVGPFQMLPASWERYGCLLYTSPSPRDS